MGAPFDGFSIREYTSKMRSIDVFKCWPFTSTINRDFTRQELQSWLPPITPCPSTRSNNHDPQNHNQLSTTDNNDNYSQEQSPKSDEQNFASPSSSSSRSPSPPLVADDDDEKLEMVCPVCREFNAATLTAVNAHIDGCLAQTVREERRHMRMMNSKTSKSKPPKKRSIAEIFKVEAEVEHEDDKSQSQTQSPQIERVMKLWPPFREDNTEDEVSVTVRKFRWLSQRLEALRSRRGGGESTKSGEENFVEEEKLEMVCPVCRDFNAATVTAVNAHIDGCLAQAVRDERRQTRMASSKPKPKAPKKRSIAEILTVAPPIEVSKSKSKAVEVEEDEDEEEDKSSDYSGEDFTAACGTVVSTIKSKKKIANQNRKKKKTKKAKNKKSKLKKYGCDSGVSLNNVKKTVENKKMKKKKNIFNNELSWNKESAYKGMVQTALNSCRKPEGANGNKMVSLQDIEPSFHRKKLGLNGLSVEKKQKVSNRDSVGKRQRALSPVWSTPKNHIRHVSGKTSNGSNFRESSEESDEKDQVLTSGKRVNFSGKNDIVSLKKRDSFDETMYDMSSDTLSNSLIKEPSSESDEETASLVATGNYDHFSIESDEDKRKEVFPLVESKQFPGTLEQFAVQTFLKPCIDQEKSRHSEQKSELLPTISVYDHNNSQFFDGGNTATLHFSPDANISTPISAVQEGQMSAIDKQVCESGVFSSSGKFVDLMEDPIFDDVNKHSNTRTFLESSSSYLASYTKVNEKPESPVQTYGDFDNSGQALVDRQLSSMLTADMMDKSYPFSSWGKGTLRNSCLDTNFFGLPLNSHGELINFSSSGNVGINQLETSSGLQGSFSGIPINSFLHQSSRENLSINERHVVKKTLPKEGLNSFPNYPPRLAVTKSCSEREDIHQPNSDMCSSHYIQPLNSEFVKQNSIEQNQCDRVQNHNGTGMVSLKEGSDHIATSSSQPTVRLMGKDVQIGRSSQEMHQLPGDVWTDEESRRRHYAEYTALESSLLGKCAKQQWVSGSPLQMPAQSVLQSAKIQSSQGLQSTILVNSTNSGFPQQFIDPQSNHISHTGSQGVCRNVNSYLSPGTQESTSAVSNGEPDDFPEQFIAGAKPLGLSPRPQVLPTPCNFSQLTCSRNGELNDRDKNPHVTKSAFGFPFLQPSVNEQVNTSWFQRPYRSMPSRFSSSTDKMLTGTFSQQFSGAGNQSFPQNRWGNNFVLPSVNHSAEVLFPSNPLTSRHPMKTAGFCPAPIVQPLQVSVVPSTINNGCRNINNVIDRVKVDDMVVKGHHPCTNTRKRPAANLDDSRKSIKLSNIEVKDTLSRMTRLTGDNSSQSSVELHRNKRAVILDPQMDSARSRCCQNEAQNLNPPSYPAVDSFKLDGSGRSGPVRLGPKRAKHILKSS